jgi:hypothetical protein
MRVKICPFPVSKQQEKNDQEILINKALTSLAVVQEKKSSG